MTNFIDVIIDAASDFRILCVLLLIIGIFLIVIYYYNIQWKDFKVEQRPHEERIDRRWAIRLGFFLFILGFLGVCISSYYLMGFQISGTAKYDDGKFLVDAEIIIPRTEPAATSEAGQYLLHNVPRNQSRISVKIKNKYIHNESINLSQYSLKPSHNQDLIIDRINLWIHGNVKNRYGPVEGVIVMLNSSEANLVSETDSFGNFDFGEVRVHHKPIGRPMTLAFKSRDERDPRIKKPITIPLEEPYEINEKDLIWPLKDEVDVEGTVSSSENDRKLKNMLVMMKSEMGESSNYTNDSGYYSLRKVPIDAKDWFIYTPEGTILANGTIFPKLTVTDTQKNWRPLQIKA